MWYSSGLVFGSVVLPTALLAVVATAWTSRILLWLSIPSLAFLLVVPWIGGTRLRVGRPRSRARGIPVGRGWSFVLGKSTRNVDAFTTLPKGHVVDQWWHAGTTIAEVQRHLRSQGQSLAGHPSLLTATLGGWIFTSSHGSGGTLWTPAFKRVKVLDHQDGDREQTLSHKREAFGDAYTIADQRRYTIVQVEVQGVPNVLCERRIAALDTVTAAKTWLTTPSHLRLAFVDRRGGTGLVWTPASGGASSWGLPAWLVSVLPFVPWSTVARTRHMHLDQANAFAPTPPLWWATACTLLYTNVELFVYVTMDATMLVQLTHELTEVHKRLGGRTDLRYGPGKLFVDLAVSRWTRLRPIFETIARVVGTDERVAVHKGKFPVADVAPLRAYM